MNFNQLDLAKLISKNSNTQVIIIKEEKIYLTTLKNLLNDEIIIGMGAGSISKWMRNIKIIYDIKFD